MISIIIRNLTHPLITPLEARYLDNFILRGKGLMFKAPLESGEGVILVGNRESRIDSAIHMFFMRMDLGIIWLDSNLRVVDKKFARRWMPFYFPDQKAQYVLEVASERIIEFTVGDVLEFNPK